MLSAPDDTAERVSTAHRAKLAYDRRDRVGQAGLVLSLDASRLARNNHDWRQLLEMCSIFGVLIVADPCLPTAPHLPACSRPEPTPTPAVGAQRRHPASRPCIGAIPQPCAPSA